LTLIDTSALIESLTGSRRALPSLRKLIQDGERVLVPSIVLYEFWRGPRTEVEIADQEALFPLETAVPFGVAEAEVAAAIYKQVSRARGREIDIAIAACALVRDARLWTINRADFAGIPGLTLA
jgi:predicted nucleic acid-binding protein